MYPAFRYITDISNAQNAVITTSEDHDFTDGEIVSFRVTSPYGMDEMNDQQAKVLSHTDDTITVDIDSMNYTAFIYPVAGLTTPPVVVPSSSGVISRQFNSEMNLEDAFDNRRA